jgi:hypothetical protein
VRFWPAVGELPPLMLSGLARLTELAVLCCDDPHTPLTVGWTAEDGSGPQLRHLELWFCAALPPSATPAALRQLTHLHLDSLRGWGTLQATLPQLAGLASLTLGQPNVYRDIEEQLSVTAVLQGAVRCAGLATLNICFNQPLLEAVPLPHGALSALTQLRLEYVKGPWLLPPSWCSLPSLQDLTVGTE